MVLFWKVLEIKIIIASFINSFSSSLVCQLSKKYGYNLVLIGITSRLWEEWVGRVLGIQQKDRIKAKRRLLFSTKSAYYRLPLVPYTQAFILVILILFSSSSEHDVTEGASSWNSRKSREFPGVSTGTIMGNLNNAAPTRRNRS